MKLENKIKYLDENLESEYKKTERLVDILKALVIDKQTNLHDIYLKINTTEKTIRKYVNDKELILKVLTKEEYKEFLPYIDLVNNLKINNTITTETKENLQKDKYNVCKSVIADVLETRYTLEQICIMNNTQRSIFNNIMVEEKYLKQNFGEDIIDILRQRISETSKIRRSVPRNQNVIEQAWDLKVVKENITYLGNYDMKLLRAVSNYLIGGADIEFVSKKFEISESTVYAYLIEPKLKDLIKENYYSDLQNYLRFEKVLKSSNLVERKKLILTTMLILKQNEYDISKTCQQLNITYNLLKKILKDNYGKIIYNTDQLNVVNGLFEEPETSSKKR